MINFQGFDVDVHINFYDENDLDWHVFDTKTSHVSLLNELLHKDYEDEICELIVKAIEKESNEAETERQLTDMGAQYDGY